MAVKKFSKVVFSSVAFGSGLVIEALEKNLSTLDIATDSFLVGGIVKPALDVYLFNIDWESAKKEIPYYTLGIAAGMTVMAVAKKYFFQ